jgi:hypothetical protein
MIAVVVLLFDEPMGVAQQPAAAGFLQSGQHVDVIAQRASSDGPRFHAVRRFHLSRRRVVEGSFCSVRRVVLRELLSLIEPSCVVVAR